MLDASLISIVDDDPLARDGIRELIESLGYNAVTFSSGGAFPSVWCDRAYNMHDNRLADARTKRP
jgi:FixJ family two-component response regulator